MLNMYSIRQKKDISMWMAQSLPHNMRRENASTDVSSAECDKSSMNYKHSS